MLDEKRTVRCLDCGYEWESRADTPRCSQAECGRSRDVVPVDELDSDGDDTDPAEATATTDGGQLQQQATETEAETETEADTDDGDDGYEPAFSVYDETDPDPADEAPTLETADDGDEEGDDEETGVETPEIDPEQLEPAIAATFEVVAARRGDHWALGETEQGRDEATMLAEAWTPVLNIYGPEVLKAEHLIIVVACSTTAAVLQPRVERDRELAEQEEAADRDDERPADAAVEPTVVEDDDLEDDEDELELDQRAGDDGGWAAV